MRQTFHIYQKMRKKIDTNVVVVGDGANMVLNEKLTINWKLRGLKLRGLRKNHVNTPIYALKFHYSN